MSQSDPLINRFVEKTNSSLGELLPPWDIPEALRAGAPDEHGYYDWQIRRSEAIDWITPYEEKLPARLPPAFRSAGPFRFFANTGCELYSEMSSAVFRDKALSVVLLSSGYIQFARPSGGSYDPICFDTKRKSGIGEYPITWIDHEGILCDDKIRIVSEVADSLPQFVEAFLHQE